jgi:hypothetical protein
MTNGDRDIPGDGCRFPPLDCEHAGRTSYSDRGVRLSRLYGVRVIKDRNEDIEIDREIARRDAAERITEQNIAKEHQS